MPEFQTMEIKQTQTFANASKLCLASMVFASIVQFGKIYQNVYVLRNPIIPKSFLWDVNGEFISKAFVLTIGTFICLPFFFFKKHLLVIILALITFLVIFLLPVSI